MNQIEMLTFVMTASISSLKSYKIEFRSVNRCSNLIIYHVTTDELKHDVRDILSLEEIIKIYE